MAKKCSNCDYAICEDHGYSNYTVEGTTVYCSLNLHPESGFDRWYGEDARDKYAEHCNMFCEEHGPAAIDVDEECRIGDRKDPNSWLKYETPKISAQKLVEIIT